VYAPEDLVATNRPTKPAALRVRVRSEDDADDLRGFCRQFGLRCTIEVDPSRPEDTTALDDAMTPPGAPRASRSLKKGET
jgi:hypothetical protein